ncbi:MAG: biopolymer transporter ExbD [Deltaproteobacteria bacterium]|jgi:biopolymer transport protein TolR|nr:biopolymer transporter ExbD [Deltaproteobacteria bacterium]
MDQREDLIPGQTEVHAISDINVTPFIDVMLVLLIIFMVTAPLMMGGVKINLPRTSGTPMPRPENPLIVSLDAENMAYVDKEPIPLENRQVKFRELAIASESGEVFVRGDGEIKYGRMMDLMTELGHAGFARVTLVTNVQSGSAPALPGNEESLSAPATGTSSTPGGSPESAPPQSTPPASPGTSVSPAATTSPVSSPPASNPPAPSPAAPSPTAPSSNPTPGPGL